jgi:hypothetical protein
MAPRPPDERGGGARTQHPAADGGTPPENQEAGGDNHDGQPPVLGNVGGPHHGTMQPGEEADWATGMTPSDASSLLLAAKPTGDAAQSGLSSDRTTSPNAQLRLATNNGEAVRRCIFPTTEGQELPTVSKVAGRWTPRERSLLLTSLAQDWTATSAPVDTPEMACLRKEAMHVV